jgi:hypothetical protein
MLDKADAASSEIIQWNIYQGATESRPAGDL